jgi:uncharacterized protein YsxB (DUF464 family)
MIDVRIFREGQVIVGFSVSGHSDYRPRGSDIVCSAISALSQTAILALDQVAGVSPEWTRQDGLLTCRLPAKLGSQRMEVCQMVLGTIITGIDSIAREFPENVKVSNEGGVDRVQN